MEQLLEVVHEDSDLLVVNKPAGLVCHPTKGDAYSSLISRVHFYLGSSVIPHLVNRLDRETSGIVVVAKDREPAVRQRKIWENGDVWKEYLAIVHGHVADDHALIDAALGKDESSQVAIKDRVRGDGATAQTEFWVAARFSKDSREFTLLRVVPRTGRKHQIRIHLAYNEHPIVGDKLYGGNENWYLAFVQGRLKPEERQELMVANHALHARRVRFPWWPDEMDFRVQPESRFVAFLPFEIRSLCKPQECCR